MKKFISIGICALIFAVPLNGALAEEVAKDVIPAVEPSAQSVADASIVSDAEPSVATSTAQEESVNPKIKFPHGMQIGLGVSATSGLGGFIGYANKDFDSFWWKRIGVRVDFATMAPLKSTIGSALNSIADDGIELDGLTVSDLSLSGHHFGMVADIYPFGNTWFLGGLRISGGYVWGNTEFSAKLAGSTGSGPLEFELNGIEYRYDGGDVTGKAAAKWNYSGPYLGAGFDLGLFYGIKIFADAGVVFSSKAAALSLNVPITSHLERWNGVNWESVKDVPLLEAEFNNAQKIALKDANDELGKYKIYPMLKLGLMYRF